MTRIYDALKKAESNRQRLGLGPSALGGMPGQDPGAGWGQGLLVEGNAGGRACFAEDWHRLAVLDPRVGSMSMAGVMTPNLGAIPATEEASRNGLVSPAAIRNVLDSALGAFDWVVLDG